MSEIFVIEKSGRNSATAFVLGLAAGAVAIAISIVLRSFADGPFIPELASQTLFSLTPGGLLLLLQNCVCLGKGRKDGKDGKDGKDSSD